MLGQLPATIDLNPAQRVLDSAPKNVSSGLALVFRKAAVSTACGISTVAKELYRNVSQELTIVFTHRYSTAGPFCSTPSA